MWFCKRVNMLLSKRTKVLKSSSDPLWYMFRRWHDSYSNLQSLSDHSLKALMAHAEKWEADTLRACVKEYIAYLRTGTVFLRI